MRLRNTTRCAVVPARSQRSSVARCSGVSGKAGARFMPSTVPKPGRKYKAIGDHCTSFVALVTVIAIACLAPVPASGQSQAQSAADTAPPWTPPRTPDGRPDLQGYWTTQTFTTLERPEHLAGKEFFTEEEAAALHQQFTAAGVDPSARDAITLEDAEAREKRLYQTNREATYVHYDNEIWLRTPVPKGLSSRRTSLITNPPDGRIPPMTPEARERAAARKAASAVIQKQLGTS